jgi:hypothetical protein
MAWPFSSYALRVPRCAHALPPIGESVANSAQRHITGAASLRRRVKLFLLAAALGSALCLRAARAQEAPYFVTYSDALEEPGNLEIELKGLTASPKQSNAFFSPTVELEYGATAWWTTEAYVEGQATENDSAIFTGFRWENRFRVLQTGHGLNPVLYVEYEDINGADKSILEVVGHDNVTDLESTNADARKEIQRELEGKLILSSYAKGWNFSENFIAEKNLASEPWEFGYALGASRPLSLVAQARTCVLCRQNFVAGAELYGGLGTAHGFGLRDTSHYAGPAVNWGLPHGTTIAFSPQFGLNDNSAGVLWRFNVSYEIQQFRDWFTREGDAR